MLPAMRGSKATLLILKMHASSTEAIHAYEKRWNPGTLQLLARQTIILSSCQDNIQFYCYLIHHKYFSYLFIFVRYFLTFCTYIFLPLLFTPHFLKIADWQSKAQCFLEPFNQRTFRMKNFFKNTADKRQKLDKLLKCL